MRASACASPGKAEGGTGRPPPPKKKKRGREGGGRENGPQPPNHPPTPQEAAKPPTQKAPETGPPKGHRGTNQPKPATPSQEQRPSGRRETQNAQTHTTRKRKKQKRASNPARKRGDGGTGTTRPGTGQPATDTTKPKQDTQKKTHPDNPTKKGGAQPRPGPSTHAHTRNHAPPIGRPDPKPNHEHHKPQPAKEGGHHKPYPNTPAQDPSQDWRGYLNPHPTATRTQTQTTHNSRKPSVHSPGTEAARAVQLTRRNEIRRPAVRLH